MISDLEYDLYDGQEIQLPPWTPEEMANNNPIINDNSLDKEDFQTACSTRWREQNSGTTAAVTFDQAKKDLHLELGRQVAHVQRYLEAKCGSRSPDFDRLVECFLGVESPVFKAFKDSGLFHNVDDFSTFIGTFFYTNSEGKEQTTEWLETEEWWTICQNERLMSTKDYREKWEQIDQKGIPLDSSQITRGFKPFWMNLEGAVNQMLREMLVQGTDEEVLNVTIDDDKIHYNTKE